MKECSASFAAQGTHEIVSTEAKHPASELHAPERISARMRIANLLAVILPFLGLIAAAVFLWGRGFSWVHLGLLLGLYLATTVGITVGFHRLFTHRAFETNRVVKFVFAVLGSMAVQGPLFKWVAAHRRHHQHSDAEGDPHSPHMHGDGLTGMLKGLWHAHIGWLFDAETPGLEKYVGDLQRDRAMRIASSLFVLWAFLGLLIPAVLGGLLTLSWMGVLLGLIWGGLARIFLVHHVTWSVNSVCHIWGSRPFQSRDHSRNNVVFGVLAMGEGWHNNHHAFPTSARHGLRWWQFDASYWVIRLLSWVGLATKVRIPAQDAIMAKSRRRHG